MITKRIDNLTVTVPASYGAESTSVHISSPEDSILLDCGDGFLISMLDTGLEIPEAVFISHDHPDHFGGLLSLLAYLKIQKVYPRIFYPYGAKGIRMIKDFFEERYRKGIFRFTPLVRNREYEFAGFKVISRKAKHSSFEYPLNSLMFEVFHGETSVFYSGDTAYFKGIESCVRGKDLALLEGSYEGEDDYLEKIHMNLEKARNLGESADDYLIIHKRRF